MFTPPRLGFAFVFAWITACSTFVQGQAPPSGASDAPQAPDTQKYLPTCSTEKVNADCFLNIDRRYPITLPTIQMRRKSRIKVYVFHPFPFETLTLDAGNPSAYESSDQASALVTAAVPVAKGASLGVINLALENDLINIGQIEAAQAVITPRLQSLATPAAVLVKRIQDEMKKLNNMLTGSRGTIQNYIKETNLIYAQVREIEASAPRPLAAGDQIFRYPGVDPKETPNPWEHYEAWRRYMTVKLTAQGYDTVTIWSSLPVPCQTGGPDPPQGPWLPPPRKCASANAATQPSDTPFDSPSGFKDLYSTLTQDLAQLPADQPDPDTYRKVQEQKAALDKRRLRLSDATNLLPGLVTKYSNDMQSAFTSIGTAPGASDEPVYVGSIPGPNSVVLTEGEKKILTVYQALGPTITFTVNEQNQIANPLLSLPAATQKQAVATITVLWASPHFEGSAGAFFSWLPNRTFSNYTDVSVTNGVPAATDVKINMTKTVPPLVIPFVAGNYRLTPEFTWPDGRRGAAYVTAGVGLNPYDTEVEYVAGISLAWRFLMFSPLVHIGQVAQLTQGERVGQLWCVYSSSATATSSPPACTGAPPTPSTKNGWSTSFAFAISVRVPTTFSSTNH